MLALLRRNNVTDSEKLLTDLIDELTTKSCFTTQGKGGSAEKVPESIAGQVNTMHKVSVEYGLRRQS